MGQWNAFTARTGGRASAAEQLDLGGVYASNGGEGSSVAEIAGT
jgi:hypothetical protein